MNKEQYQEYLRTDEWAKKRLAVIERANNRCSLCGDHSRYMEDKSELHVHHNNYENVEHELDSDLIALCPDCHTRYHSIDPPEGRIWISTIVDVQLDAIIRACRQSDQIDNPYYRTAAFDAIVREGTKAICVAICENGQQVG